MSIKKVLKNALWVGIIPKFSSLLSLFLLPFVTPFLSATDYGIFGIVTSYTSFFYAVFTLGLNVHFNSSFFEYKSKFNLIWGRIYFLLLISGIICSIIISFIFNMILKDISFERLFMILIFVTSQFLFGSHLLLASHLFPLRDKYKQMVIPILLSNTLGVILSFYCVKYLKLGYIGLLSNAGISTFLTFLFFARELWIKEKILPIVELNINRLKSIFKISLPIIPHTFGFMLLATSDRLVMQFYNVPIRDIGIYTNGYNIGDYINILSSALIVALSPSIQRLYYKKEFFKIKQLFIFTQVITLFIVFVFSIWMKEFYYILIKNVEFQESSYVANLISFSSIFYPIYYLFSMITFLEKKTTKILWLVFLPGILNFILNLIFIPFFGYKAALLTTLFSYWIILLIPFFVVYYKEMFLNIFHSTKILFYLFIMGVILLIFSFYLIDSPLIYKFMISFFLFIFICLYIIYSQKKIINIPFN